VPRAGCLKAALQGVEFGVPPHHQPRRGSRGRAWRELAHHGLLLPVREWRRGLARDVIVLTGLGQKRPRCQGDPARPGKLRCALDVLRDLQGLKQRLRGAEVRRGGGEVVLGVGQSGQG
jgi:hypothetical protein